MGGASVVIHRGPRAAEAALLAELRPLLAEVAAAARPGAPRARLAELLARPVRIVVPSGSLREHLAAVLVRSAPGGGLVGVAVQTLRGVAFEILRRAGEPGRGGHALFPIVVRQLAREEAALRADLDDLEDGYGAVAASVSDLLDAGYEPELAEPLDDCLSELPEGARTERARALVRVATRTAERLAGYGLEHRSALYRRAREALEAQPDALPSRALFVHGYADATGVQLDLLRALVSLAGARVLLDQPADPADPSRADSGVLFTERLLAGLGAAGVDLTAEAPETPPAQLECFRASGAQAEAREVAERLRAALSRGVRPEEIGVVARDLGPYRLALQVHLGRLGIPFSGGEGFLGPAGRRLRALLDLLRDGEEAAADRWLDATHVFAAERLRDLRLALHGIGLGRVRDVAALDVARVTGERGYRLPVRRGLGAPPEAEAERDDGEVEGAPREAPPARPLPRRLAREGLARAVAEASRAAGSLRALRGVGSLGELLEGVRELSEGVLAWTPEGAGLAELRAASDRLEEELGGAVALSFAEGRLLLEQALRDAGRGPLGGAGGGVQLLSVVEARARTFRELFVLGLNRDLFPRAISEDPLLRDAERRALAPVLPDVPIKSRGFAEERYLFAQLCAAAERVTLSWQAVSDDGKERPASPLVEPLLRGGSDRDVALAPGVYDLRGEGALQPAREGALRPAHEHAILAGLTRDRPRLEAALALSFAAPALSFAAPAPAPDPRRRARARVAVLDELDSLGRGRSDLGPFFGFVGAIQDAGDPRRAPLFVTRLEGLARCGWQVFLERLLGLLPVPDALEALPDLSRLLVGQVVHGVLEAIVAEAGAPTRVALAEALAVAPRDVAWPSPERVDALLRAAAESAAREAGIALPGFARVLARRALPFLESVRRIDWAGGVARAVRGAELEGEVALPLRGGAARRLRFRADRADGEPGALRLTDYKVGKPFSAAADAGRQRATLRDRIADGSRLQAAAYALADAPGGTGRYLFALPDLEASRAVSEIDAGDEEGRRRFEATVHTLCELWERGSFVPRLLGPDLSDTPDACKWCEVSAACPQGDSGARRRLAGWLERHADASEAPASPAERALLAAWQLGREAGS